MSKVVVGIGEALWDCLPQGRQFGGAPTNFAYHCGQFGLESYALSAVGHDALGDEIIAICEEKRQRYIIPRVPYETGTVQVTLNADGIPQYEIKQGVAWDNIPFTAEMETLASRTDAVCWGSLAQRNAVSRQTIRHFIQAMPAHSLKVFDINLRQSFYSLEIIQDSLRSCNILKINDEELDVLGQLMGEGGTCPRLIKDYSLDLLILTCGTNGSRIFLPDGTSSFQPTPVVQVADTVGAGDSFTAAFVSSLLLGIPVNEAHRRAVEVSAFVCTQHGAMPVLPAQLVEG